MERRRNRIVIYFLCGIIKLFVNGNINVEYSLGKKKWRSNVESMLKLRIVLYKMLYVRCASIT